jgi:membrane-bound lytic murein transglycosylase C
MFSTGAICRWSKAISTSGLLIICPASLPFADELSDNHEKQEREFKAFQRQRDSDVAGQGKEFRQYFAFSQEGFAQWKKNQEEEYNEFRNAIRRQWGSFIEPSNKKWVEYGKDTKTVAVVDFEKGTVRIEALRLPGESGEEVQRQLNKAIIRVIESKGSAETVPVESDDSSQTILEKPLLADQLISANGQRVNKENVEDFIHEVQGTKEAIATENGQEKVIVTFPLAPDHLKKRMQPFLPYIKKYCSQYGIDAAQVIATIHTESYFNPAARSNRGAVGLMQLVPEKGGAEAYRQLKGNDSVPCARYMYDPEKNIELGCVYIYLLQTKYFGRVNDKESNMYCSIAGYNTGPGNVALVFSNARSLEPSIDKINALAPREIYSSLIAKLPYSETRNYLKIVVGRMALYR